MVDNEIMEITKQTAFNLQAVSEQMGMITSTVKQQGLTIREHTNDIRNLRYDFEKSEEKRRQNEYCEPAEQQKIYEAVHNRVTDICKEYGCYDYYGAFCKKAWFDGKKHSYVLGKAGVYTKKMYVKDVINYYGTWIPEGYGIDGYINRLRRNN